MAKGKKKDVVWDAGDANPKQLLFYQSRAMYTAYGGARGGGKTHAVRIKAVGGAIANPGIKILIMRKTYGELEKNHIRPIISMVPRELASYNATSHLMTFHNGSTIQFGHWAGEVSEQEYQGIEFDWIFIDEATQFSERAFRYLGGCLRGVNEFPKRMYLTCNPGGVGHRWVKRLFIDRQFKTNPENPEETENPDDYVFIPALVEDNTALMNSSGGKGYLNFLAQMPEDQRRAFRYGDWNALGGNYFPEFGETTHTCAAFEVPKHWARYCSFDYGLDMFACFWWAVDEDGRSWCVREYTRKGLIAREAAAKMHELTPEGQEPFATYAPPDMWSRQKDTGQTIAEIFMKNGIGLVKASNNRVQGHNLIKEALAPKYLNDPFVKEMYRDKDGNVPETLPGMMFFRKTCRGVIGDLQDIQADELNPDDCAKVPHEITHTVDGVRYYAISRVLPAQAEEGRRSRKVSVFDLLDGDEDDGAQDYNEWMCGGEVTESYLGFA